MGLTIAWAIYVTTLFWWSNEMAPEEFSSLMQVHHMRCSYSQNFLLLPTASSDAVYHA